MNAGPTSTRIYEALLHLLRVREYPPGRRLDPILLGDELGSSPTPVRDALHILAGEELVVSLPNGGFTTPIFHEKSLADLYAWNADVVAVAIRDQRYYPPSPAPEEIKDIDNVDLADRSAALFQWVADGSSNIEHPRAQSRINARLRLARLAEATVMKESDSELDGMAECFGLLMFSDMKKRLKRYTERRKRLSGQILMQMQNLYYK